MENLGNISKEMLALLITIIIGVPGVIFGFLAIKRKVLKYDISSKGHIINTESNKILRNEIEIKYKGKPVNDVWFYELWIENSGNSPVEKKDFESPITVCFENGKIISCMYGFKKPSNLQFKSSYTEKEVKIYPMLLNSKDKFYISILVDQQNECLPNVLGRISGTELKRRISTDTTVSIGPYDFLLGSLIEIYIGLVILFTIGFIALSILGYFL